MTIDDVMKKNYETLMSCPNKEDYYLISDLGCGMVKFRSIDWLDKELIIVDEEAKRAYPIVSREGRVWGLYTLDDLVPECRDRVWVKDGFLWVTRHMSVGRFENGVTEISWLINADSETQDLEYLNATIDRQCRLLSPFSTERSINRP